MVTPQTPTHVVTSVKCFAVLESVVELHGTVDDVVAHLRANRFRGNITVNFSQGGITNVTSREHIPISLEQLESLCQKA